VKEEPRIGPPVKKPEGWYYYQELMVPDAIKIMRKCGCPEAWADSDVERLIILADGANGPIDHAMDIARLLDIGGPELVFEQQTRMQKLALRLYEMFNEAPEALAQTLLQLRRYTTKLRTNTEFQVACYLCDGLGINPDLAHLWEDKADSVALEMQERLGIPAITGKIVEHARTRVRDALKRLPPK